MSEKFKQYLQVVKWWLFLAIVLGFIYFLSLEPSHDRDWEIGQEKHPSVSIEGEVFSFNNVRDFTWNENGSPIENKYVSRSINLKDVSGVEVIISHFSPYEEIAHVFLNFVIDGEEGLPISIEARREKTEDYSPFKGLFNRYELLYVVGTENDLIGLRSDIRKEEVYRYPTVADREQSQALFLKLVEDINRINDNAEFYNTLTKNCTNIIARHVEYLTDIKVPFYYSTLAPGKIDKAMYDLNLIENGENFEALQQKYLIKPAPESPVFKEGARILEAIENEEALFLYGKVHPDKGIRFSPYGNINIDSDLVFTRTDMATFVHGLDDYTWGSYDGSGEPIVMNPEEYFDAFVYSHDFIYAPSITLNASKTSGNLILNTSEIYPDAQYVEYYFPGFNEEYEGFDWVSLTLVMEEFEGEWYLVGVIHNEWTI